MHSGKSPQKILATPILVAVNSTDDDFPFSRSPLLPSTSEYLPPPPAYVPMCPDYEESRVEHIY